MHHANNSNNSPCGCFSLIRKQSGVRSRDRAPNEAPHRSFFFFSLEITENAKEHKSNTTFVLCVCSFFVQNKIQGERGVGWLVGTSRTSQRHLEKEVVRCLNFVYLRDFVISSGFVFFFYLVRGVSKLLQPLPINWTNKKDWFFGFV